MGFRDKLAEMTATRTIVGYASGSHTETFRTSRTNTTVEITGPMQADQIIKQGLASWALVLGESNLIVSEHGDVPALNMLGLRQGTAFRIRGRDYTMAAGSANSYAHNGTKGIRYDVPAFTERGRLTRVVFDARTRIDIRVFRLLVSDNGMVHASDPARPDYFLCGAGGKFGPPKTKAEKWSFDTSGVECSRCRTKLDNNSGE